MLYPFAAIIIKPENLIVGIAQLGHVHGAALAHAHAVAVAACFQHKVGPAFGDAPQLVVQ